MMTTTAPANSSKPFPCATSTSVRANPNVCRSVGGRCVMRNAAYATDSTTTSVAMCAASASNASDPNAKPPATSTPRKRAFATRANRKARLRACPNVSMQEFYVREGLRMSRSETLGSRRLPSEQLLDVLSQLLIGGRPAVRADATLDGRHLDRPVLVGCLVDREAELQRPGRGPGIEIRRLPGDQSVDERRCGASEGAVVRRVE